MRQKSTIKHRIVCASILGLCTILIIGFICLSQQQGLSSKLIRLHVIANSDTDLDQSIKDMVRDSINEEMTILLADVREISEAEQILSENLSIIENNAKEVLLREGYTYQVCAELRNEIYSTRKYDTFNLPAGVYKSLKVVIGEGNGRNWWCVVFPPLCFAGAAEFEEAAEAAGLSENEIRLISEQNDTVVFRFKILELFEKLVNYIGLKK